MTDETTTTVAAALEILGSEDPNTTPFMREQQRLLERAVAHVTDAIALLGELETNASDYIDARDGETHDGTMVCLPEDHPARETLYSLEDWIASLENVEGEINPSTYNLDPIKERKHVQNL